jgi:Zn-dependent protease with chaperone function
VKYIVKIKKLYNDILKILPKEYRYDVRICSSYPEMVAILVARDNIKKNYKRVAEEFKIEVETDKVYNRDSKYSIEIAQKYPRRRLKRYVRPILGFSGNPILLNRGVLDKESKYFVAAVILHEIGHNVGYTSEGGADKFALEWMKEVEPVIRKRTYYD